MEEGEGEEKAREKDLKRGSKGSVWKEKEARERERGGEGRRVQQSGAEQAPSEQGQREKGNNMERQEKNWKEKERLVWWRAVSCRCVLRLGRGAWSLGDHPGAGVDIPGLTCFLTQALGTHGLQTLRPLLPLPDLWLWLEPEPRALLLKSVCLRYASMECNLKKKF